MGNSVEAYLVYGISFDSDFFEANGINTAYCDDEEDPHSCIEVVIRKYLEHREKEPSKSWIPFDYIGVGYSGVGATYDGEPPYAVYSKYIWSRGDDMKEVTDLFVSKEEQENIQKFAAFVNENFNCEKKVPSWILFGSYG